MTLTGLLVESQPGERRWDVTRIRAQRNWCSKSLTQHECLGVFGRGGGVGAGGRVITRIGSLASALHCRLFEINLATHDLAGLSLCLDMSLCLPTQTKGLLRAINKHVKQAFSCTPCMWPLWKTFLFLLYSLILSQGAWLKCHISGNKISWWK